MERKLLKNLCYKSLLVFIALLTFGVMGAQNVTFSWDPIAPNVFNFGLTNGVGSNNHFTSSTTFYLQILTTPNFANGTHTTVQIFNLNSLPIGNNASANYQRNFSIPNNHPLNFHTYS